MRNCLQLVDKRFVFAHAMFGVDEQPIESAEGRDFCRDTRSSSQKSPGENFAAERSLGIPERTVMGRFLLKPSLIPTVSILGLDFAAGLSNAFLVELIFNWPGLSRYGMNAILRKGLNASSGVILVLGVVFIVVNILVDIIVAQLDPRIRLRSARSD